MNQFLTLCFQNKTAHSAFFDPPLNGIIGGGSKGIDWNMIEEWV